MNNDFVIQTFPKRFALEEHNGLEEIDFELPVARPDRTNKVRATVGERKTADSSIMCGYDNASVQVNTNRYGDQSFPSVLFLFSAYSADAIVNKAKLLTSTSKFTSSPSRKTTVHTRPFLIGILPWFLLIEWILPFEFKRWGRNFELLGWGVSSFNAVAWCFAWRRLKKRIKRAAAMNYLACNIDIDGDIPIAMVIFKRKGTNDVIIESTRRSSTTRATAQSKCFVHRSIRHGQENKNERGREREMIARRSWWYRREREKREKRIGGRESEQKVGETDRCQLNEASTYLISQRQATDRWSSVGNVGLLLLLAKIIAYVHDRSPLSLYSIRMYDNPLYRCPCPK